MIDGRVESVEIVVGFAVDKFLRIYFVFQADDFVFINHIDRAARGILWTHEESAFAGDAVMDFGGVFGESYLIVIDSFGCDWFENFGIGGVEEDAADKANDEHKKREPGNS